MLTIRVRTGRSKGRELLLDGPSATVGRGGDCELPLADAHVSTRHGRFERTELGFSYRDLKSTNGSCRVRDQQELVLDPNDNPAVPLAVGDLLLLGDREHPVVLEVLEDTALEGDDDRRDVLALRRVEELPQLTRQISREPARLEVLYRVSQRIVQGPDLGDVLKAIAGAILELLPRTTHLAVYLREADRFVQAFATVCDTPEPQASEQARELKVSHTLLKRVLAERAAVLASNAAEEFSGSHSIARAQILSTLCVPLWSDDAIIGVIQADNRNVVGSFDENDLEAITVMASQLSLAIRNARLYQRLRLAEEAARGEAGFLKRQDRKQRRMITGGSAAMHRVMEMVARVKDTPVPVCILGETGTGKELIARAIHDEGDRADRLFVAQNMAALPDSLLESELFGHKRGAFTGADRDKKGLFELADCGTIFLDEIGELSPTLQAKLLRVLQEGEIRPVGSPMPKRVDVRVISATHRNLEDEVQAGRFREDLYYRLMVFPIHLPPLRERSEDVEVLARYFLERYAVELKRPAPALSPAAVDALRCYSWPGNIRELENETQRLVIYGADGGLILPEHLSMRVRQTGATLERLEPRRGTLKEMVAEVERVLISRTMKETGGNKTQAARILGLTREGLHKKMNKLGIV